MEATLLELEPKSELIGSSRSPEQANSVKAIRAGSIRMEHLRAAKRILLVIVLPRNAVAKHLMIPCDLASFPTSVFNRHGSGTALDFHKVTLKGWCKYRNLYIIIMSLTFIETSVFTKRVKELMSDDNYRCLQTALINDPEFGDLIKGSGGLRKIRWGNI